MGGVREGVLPGGYLVGAGGDQVGFAAGGGGNKNQRHFKGIKRGPKLHDFLQNATWSRRNVPLSLQSSSQS